MKLKLTLFFIILILKLNAQTSDIWTAFDEEKEDGYLFGYKNSKGEVMIEPKFMGFSTAKKFDKIAALMEEKEGKYDSYYLLKDGTKFGADSLYVFDMGYDCESEGFIKFRDPKTEKVGMFNEFGKVTIPAQYNDMTGFVNGLSIGLKNAKKEYWDKEGSESGCEHWSWVEGEEVLINTKNEILVNNFPLNNALDFYSLQVSEKPILDSTRVNFLGTNNKYYSFVDNEKLLKVFLKEQLLNNLTIDNFIEHSYPKILFWTEEGGYSKPKKDFIKQNFSILSQRLSEIKKEDTRYSINTTDNLSIPDEIEQEFDKYYLYCGGWNAAKYPIITLEIIEGDIVRDDFYFIKIDNKIQLISCVLRGSDLK